MNKSTLLKVIITTVSIYILYSFTMYYMADPPIVNDITVCEGGSTLIIPMESGGGQQGGIVEVIATEDFDGEGLGYTPSIQFNDGSNDHFNLTDGSDISNVTGNYSFETGVNFFWAAEDTDDNGGDGMDEQSIIFNPINITNYINIEFCFDLAAGNEALTPSDYDLADHVLVDYSFDGTNYNSGLCFNSALDGDNFNSSFHADPNCDNDGIDGVQILNQAQTFCFTIPMTETIGQTNLTYRILVYMDSADEEIAFDNIFISGESTASGAITFNYYDEEPVIGTTVPVVSDAPSYDPMTTVASSPDTIWVTADDGVMESIAVPVVVTVNDNPNAEAGPSGFGCGLTPIAINADPISSNLDGNWSGGSGTFESDTSASTNYIPDPTELDAIIELTWTVNSSDCGELSDNVNVYAVMEPGDAEFTYFVDTICPGDGSLFPMHTTGVDGTYELLDGDPDSISLDASTGEIDLSQSGMGTFVIQNTTSSCGNLMLTGVIDGPLTGGIPKAIELYAVNDIANLSDYSIGSANNGGGTDGEEFNLPQEFVSAGSYLYLASDSVAFEAWFEFKPDFVSNAALINGDDAIELFCNGEVIDLFGDIDVDGSGQPWEYLDGWAYRTNNQTINLGDFDDTNWIFSGINALDGESDNDSATSPFPVGSFETGFSGICPNNTFLDTISIGDFEMPMIVCPSDMTISLDAGECGTFIQLFDPTAMDNCSDTIIFTQISGPVSGDFLDKENSPYEVIYEGEEMNGNILTCAYTITIEEFQSPSTTLACNGMVNVSLDESCETLITADMILEGGAYGCYDDYGIQVTLNGNTIGAVVDNDFGSGYSVYLDDFYINELLEVSVIDLETGNSCWGFIQLEDKYAPQFDNCEDMTVSCGADISPVPPASSDNCAEVVFDMDEDIILGTCLDTFSQQIIRTWQIADLQGNMGEECVQVITVLKEDFDNLELPLSYDGLEGNFDVLKCNGEGITFAVNEEGLPSPIPVGILPGTGEPTLGAGCADLMITYTDDVIPLCGSSYKVLRNWTVIDWCSGETVEYIQVIKVQDNVAPSFNNPIDVTIAANADCIGEYQLPLILTDDNCSESSIYFESSVGIINNGFFVLENPQLNQPYVINAIAIDECGNENEKEFNVTFVDLTPPVANAEESLTITLSQDGTAKLFSSSFDDGSYDACTGVGFSIIRMFSICDPIDYDAPPGDDNFQFNDVVHFCCSDVGEPQMINFKVCDDADLDGTYGSGGDNCNTAMVEVIVQDKLPPTIICPANTTVSCVDVTGIDWTDNDLLDGLFGAPTAKATCNVEIQPITILEPDFCPGEETIIFRSFVASNENGTAQCTQQIQVSSFQSNKLTCNRIRFDDLNNSTYNWCKVNDNINDDDDDIPALVIPCDASFEAPALDIDINGLCTEVGEKVSIDTFNFANGACKKYLLHYEVIDQCVFDDNFVNPITNEIDPYNSQNGYFEFYLEIDAFDNTPPVFDPEDVEFNSTFCDQGSIFIPVIASDECTAEEDLTYLWKIDYYSDNSIDFPASGYVNNNFIASGVDDFIFAPIGEHTIYWRVDDGCGNSVSRTQRLTINPNTKAPTPYCKTGLKASLSAMGMLTIDAEDFDAGSFDNCDSQDDLVFSFSPDTTDTERMYTCDDLGFQFIQVYVTDLDGNQDFCNTSFLVQDNGEFCTNSLVLGSVVSNEGYKNSKAQLLINQGSQTLIGMETDVEGEYLINPSNYDNATLKVIDDNSLLMGVTSLDIITIQKHILGIAPFTSNKNIIAADVDNNGKVTGADIIQLRKAILGYQDYFKNNHSWIAIPKDTDVESLINPFEYPKYINISSDNQFDWMSLKVGDVNMTHNNINNSATTRSFSKVEYIETIENGDFVYEFFTKDQTMVGLDIDIRNISSEDLLMLDSESISLNSTNYNFENDNLLIRWSDISGVSNDRIFRIVSKSKIDINNVLTGVTYSGFGIETEVRTIQIVKREVEKLDLTYNISVYPNPFSENLQVDLSDIDFKKAELSVLDNNGRSIYSRSLGTNKQLTLSEEIFQNSGVYFIRITTDSKSIIQKVIRID